MNLIKDAWIPVVRADGSNCMIAPWEIGASDNPVVEIVAPRPDFRGALYQFLIGLIQTTFAPEDDDEWQEKWKETPSSDELKMVFEKVADAFELVNEDGPAFMQDFALPEKAEEFEIRGLLIDAPGANTLRKNLDHFVKRDSDFGMCNSCLASAIMTLQTNAPSGGQGHRTGLRGGGPLTTLIFPDELNSNLWKMLWLNVLSLDEQFSNKTDKALPEIFPWMGETRVSPNGEQTFPEDVDKLQLYWGTPRRIRITRKIEEKACNVCGCTALLWLSYRAINFGVNYSSNWEHTLSPYRKTVEKDKSTSHIAFKGKQGGLTYSDWLSLTLRDDGKETSALVVSSFIESKIYEIEGMTHPRLWCFGYDMDNMKARCWYDQTMPILILSSDENRATFIEQVEMLVASANDTSKLLRDAVKSAWFKRPKDARGDTTFILTAFWEETETCFYVTIEKLRDDIEANESTASILREWAKIIISSAEKLFDRFALTDTDEIKNMKRIAGAARMLTNILNSPKTKSIQALKED
jgi:CRISPR system Cascade subunit CasA